jgi:ferredoxin--NADP+ reductase
MALPTELNAVLTLVEEYAPGLVVMRIAPSGWELPPFIPGQFCTIGLPASAPRLEGSDAEDLSLAPDRFIRRAYSIASSSRQREYLELYVALVTSGELTPRLLALRPGDRLWLARKITGLFTLKEIPPEKNLVMVATGTGIAPYMSMLRTELDPAEGRRIALLLGARHSWDLGYSRELFTMQRESARLTVLRIVSRPKEEKSPWPGHVGHVQSLWTGSALAEAWGRRPTPEDTHVLLCGNPAMIDDMTKVLVAEGFRPHERGAPGQIHAERYW